DPIVDALKDYVKESNTSDPSIARDYTYRLNSSGFEQDTKAAGTVSNEVAWRTIAADSKALSAADKAKAKRAFDALSEMGAVFGYDGFQESGCAAPTDYMLVIDVSGKKVYTIELTPCDEG